MEEKEISIEESLQIMQSMVRRAQNNLSENGFLFIFWGWLVFIVSMVFYAMITNGVPIEKASLIWSSMAVGGIFTAIYSIRKNKKEKVKSYIDNYMGVVWTAFGIAIFITFAMGNKLQMNCYPIVIMLYAITTFITGGIIRFVPLMVCGALSFPICVLAFCFKEFENQVLMLALSVIVSYIVPGHWLQLKFKKAKHGV